MAVIIKGFSEMPNACKDCRFARLIPFVTSKTPRPVYKCFLTRQIDTKEAGRTERLSECPLYENPEPQSRTLRDTK